MAVQVLTPQNFLQDSFHRQPLASGPMNRNPKPNRVNRPHPEKKTRKSNRPNNSPPKAPAAANKLVMGQVKILKRGEEIPKAAATPPPKQTPQVPDLGSNARLGPEPKLIQKLVPKLAITAEPKPVQSQIKTVLPKPVQNQMKTAEPKPKPVQNRTKTASLKLVQKKTKLADSIVAGFYAGSASSVTSPEPSAVPLPSFFAKKASASAAAASTTGEATSALLRLLRLNLS